jgi:hypothetical protein
MGTVVHLSPDAGNVLLSNRWRPNYARIVSTS